jgi:hypothetical protein
MNSQNVAAKVLDVSFSKPGFSGMERVIMTSDGNLQRTMRCAPRLTFLKHSAYYNHPVTMEIVRFDRRGSTDTFDREVALKCQGKTFCRATTVLTVTNPEVEFGFHVLN